MLNKKYNKFGGTELRVKRQLPCYLQLIHWIKEMQEQGVLSKDDWNKEFVKWAQEEQIYNYKSDSIKNRFNMIISALSKLSIQYKDGKFLLPKIISEQEIFKNMQKYANENGVRPFYELLKFAAQTPKEINVKKIINSFQVFDGQEPFDFLYDNNVVELISNSFSSNQVPSFRKPPIVKKYIDLIYTKKTQQELLTKEDFQYFDHKKDKYIWKTVFKDRERFNLATLINRINTITLEEFLKRLNSTKIKALLEKEYYDLFSRWLYDFGLIDVAGKNAKTFYSDRLALDEDGFYIVIPKEEKLTFPYSIEEVSDIVEQISNDDFYFKYNDPNLEHVANSVLAEYFINMYYSHKLNLTPFQFTKFANTKINNKLYPVFTAPGGVPDMSIFINNSLINIETTIHNNVFAIQKNEIYQCIKHFDIHKYNASDNYLIFISPIEIDKYERYFFANFKLDYPNENLILSTFSNLIVPQL